MILEALHINKKLSLEVTFNSFMNLNILSKSDQKKYFLLFGKPWIRIAKIYDDFIHHLKEKISGSFSNFQD